MNETQKDGRSTYGSPAPLSREQMQQQMQAAFQDGSNRPRKKKQPEQRRISAMCIAAAVHRHRLFRHGIETAVRKNRNIMAVRMWHLPEKAERLLVL